MNLFLIPYDNGLDEELRETKVLGVFDELQKAKVYLLTRGFYESDVDDLFFPRYEDSAIIQTILSNTTIDELHF